MKIKLSKPNIKSLVLKAIAVAISLSSLFKEI